MACDAADRIAAIVSLAGATYLDPEGCQPSEPVSALQVHGDLDTVILYGGTAGYPSATATIATWAAKNGCAGALEPTGERIDLDENVAGAETSQARHAGCPADGAAELWTIEGGGHVPRFGDGWAPAVWEFLQAHPKL
jgi:polyhydroxybutyrate depolymerase